MLKLTGYRLGPLIYRSQSSEVSRATRLSDGRSVVIKALPGPLPSQDQKARLEREFVFIRRFDDDGVIRALALESEANGLAMVVEDFGGHSLLESSIPEDLESRLSMAIGVASALEAIHKRRIIHKDLNPANIVWEPSSGRVKIIDFGISTELSQETAGAFSPKLVEGTLSYLSPEQTGRMNRVIDYRSDLYSLGAVLYWLFTGARPFEAEDPMEMIHQHIAVRPAPPSARAPELPEPISELILKLMAKNAEDRYQCVTALRRDLERCRAELRAGGRVAPFELAADDLSERFVTPQRLYGRERELGELMEAFGRAAQGSKELFLVAGYSGVGKSALVREVHKPMVSCRGLFGQGKFDQFNRAVPYSCLTQAFQALVNQLLTCGEDELEAWRRSLQAAVGGNGRVFLDVIPELAHIIGEQPPLAELSAVEAQHRFDAVFTDVLKVFASAEHPLVLFLDDLQWADGPSLRLIKRFMADDDAGHLLLIGAYRDNEVQDRHPLLLTIEEIRGGGGRVTGVELAPLREANLTRFLVDTLRRDDEDLAELAALCFEKTRGNPFFLTRLLRTIYEEGGFWIDRAAGRWAWDLELIAGLDCTENVVDLMVHKIRKLPRRTVAALQLASCIGARFDLHTLGFVRGGELEDTGAALWPALKEGLVLAPSGEAGRALERVRYRWLHDRVQQAAYALIEDDERSATHDRLGRLLRARLSEGELEDRLFEVVGHLNRGASCLGDAAARDDLAELNLRAGAKALGSCAFLEARRFFERGLELLGADAWERAYRLALELRSSAAHAAALVSDFEAARGHYEEVLARARGPVDKVSAYETWISACVLRSRHHEGMRAALEILALLGVTFPAEPGPADVGAYLQRVGCALAGRAFEEIADGPANADPESIAALRILGNIASTAYIAAPALFPLVILEGVARSLTDGLVGVSAILFAGYAIFLCGAVGDLDSGRRFVELARRVVRRFDAREYACKVTYIYGAFIAAWSRHLRDAGPLIAEARRLGLENGDHEFGAWAVMVGSWHDLVLGEPLGAAIDEARPRVGRCLRLDNLAASRYARSTLQAMLCLRGEAEDPCALSGEALDEAAAIERYTEVGDGTGLSDVYVLKAFLYVLFERWDEAIAQEALAAPWISAVTSLVQTPLFRFCLAFARLARAHEVEGEERARLLAATEATLEEFEGWAAASPANFLPMHRLLLGERRALEGAQAAAAGLLTEAVLAAESAGYRNFAALGEERLGRLWLRRGDPVRARGALERALDLYGRWGALAKRRALRRAHSTVLGSEPRGEDAPRLSLTKSTAVLSAELDIATVLKANQAIASRVQREDLLRTVLEILIENAGATGGAVIREGEEGPKVEALCRSGGPVEVFDGEPLGASGLPASLINLVRRSGKAAVVDDCAGDPRFAGEAWSERSALCLPALSRGKLLACLYLSNDLSEGVFTDDRIALLEMLLRQVEISLENARVYRRLEFLVEERTAELKGALSRLEEQQERLVTQEKLASLGALTAGIAHELKNPLNFVVNLSELSAELVGELRELGVDGEALASEAGRRVLSENLDGLCQSVTKIHEHGIRADQIIRSMLAHSRGHHGERERFDLNLIVETSLRLIQDSELGGRHVATVLELSADLPSLDCVPQGLIQAFRNIIENAWHALRSASRPEIRLATLEEDEDLVVIIRDNGPGIDAETRAKIFSPFFTTKPAGEGTGLGLSITHDIVVKLHEGRIDIDSAPGEFTEFTIRLPKRRPASAQS